MNDVVLLVVVELVVVGVFRIVFGIEYKGFCYCGWQCQEVGVFFVQEVLECVLLKVVVELVGVICVGCIDVVVYVSGQVVYFDIVVECLLKVWVMGINVNLFVDISVIWVRVMLVYFYVCFLVMVWCYCYVIYNDLICLVYLVEEVIWNYWLLDIGWMCEVVQVLVGIYDFILFWVVQCQVKLLVKIMYYVCLLEYGWLIVLDICGNVFFYYMVCNIVGVLMIIGVGEWLIEWVKEVFEVCDWCVGGVIVYFYGFYLVWVEYFGEFELFECYLGLYFFFGLFDIVG